MSKPYQAILFDLDGTLTDPKIGITRSVQYALSKFDIEITNLETLIPFIGPPLIESFQKYFSFTEQQAQRAIEYYREYFSVTGIYENQIFLAIPELLSLLQKKNKLIILATSKPTVYAEKILHHFNIYQFFSLVIGSNLDGTRTTKTEVITAVLEAKLLCSLSKERMLMVGDREHDIIGAHENEIAVIGVTYGYGSKEELQNKKPEYLVHSITELKNVLCGLI